MNIRQKIDKTIDYVLASPIGFFTLLMIGAILLGSLMAHYDSKQPHYLLRKDNWECTHKRMMGKIFVCTQYSRK